MLPAARDPTRLEDWEKRIRYISLPTLWLSIFFSGALSGYTGIKQHECTEHINDFDLLYHLSLSVIPACVLILFYLLNIYGFLLVLDDWFRVSSTILHLILYAYYGVLITILTLISNPHLETDYNDSDCLDKFDQKHQQNTAWAGVVLCIVAMSLIQLTPFKEYVS
tara:strand:- start:161 stop:658 length:498 start_codon:yes stop_codon:yes gene_type:complete